MNKNEYIDIEKLMKNRVSVKRFDPNYQIDNLILDKLIESIRYSPSSMGLLNTRIILFKNGKFKNDLINIFYNQDNFKEASAHIILITDKPEIILEKTWPKTLNNKFKENESELKNAYHQKFLNLWNQRFDNGKNIEKIRSYLYNQVYIYLGIAITCAAVLGIDTCPHGGMDKKALDDYLYKNKIIGKDQEAVVALALGKIDKKNHIFTPKTRLSKEEFKIEILD